MVKLAKYLKDSIGVILVIIALLTFQAYCDLQLPNYTSKIVTGGIQQKGVSDAVPEKISLTTMEDLKLVLDEDVYAGLQDYYTRQSNVYLLNTRSLTKEERTALSAQLINGEVFLMFTSAYGSGSLENAFSLIPKENAEAQSDLADIMANVPEGEAPLDIMRLLPSFLRKTIMGNVYEQMEGFPISIREQMAIQFVLQEYEGLGEDMTGRQNAYLFENGFRMLILAFGAMAAAICVVFLASRMAAKTARNLRNDVYRKVMQFNDEEFHRFSTASLITRSTNDIQQVQMLLALGLRVVLYAPILGIGALIKVLKTEATISWVIALAVGIILVLILVLFRVAMPKFTILQTLIDRLNLVSREQLTGVMVTRAFSAEKHEEDRFEKANQDLTKTNLFVNRCMTFMMPVMMLVMNGISVLIIYTGAMEIDQGAMQVGDMMAFIQYAMQIIMAFLMISVMSIIIPRANVAAKRIAQVLGTDIRMPEALTPVHPEEGMRGLVEFDHVSFSYPDAQENVLTDITFSAKQGQTIAFIGSTGSGKTTLINLIPRFYDVTGGAVRIDGVDVRQMDREELCGKIGYVPQKSILFSGTIESNIAYGRAEASREEIALSARIAQAEEFILEKTDDYESPIAQGGTNVSGGQRQRLSIARAIAKKPEILIFDDSFSALDFKTDAALRRALQEHTKDTTKLIVAQRISTIIHADQIIVLDEGRVAGKGTHQELMERCEVYRQIATSQLSQEELAG